MNNENHKVNEVIFTDESGRPIPRPSRKDYESDYEWVMAFHEWKRKIDSCASRAVYEKVKIPSGV